MFINTTEELTESGVRAIVGMDTEEGLEEAVRRAVDGAVRVVGVKRPVEEKIREAPDVVKKPDEPAKKGKTSGARYHGLLPELDLEKVSEEQLKQADRSGAHTQAKEAFESLRKDGRDEEAACDAVHSKSLPGEKNLWHKCAKPNRLGEPPLFKGRLGNLVWNGIDGG